jgi:hypothetical protein
MSNISRLTAKTNCRAICWYKLQSRVHAVLLRNIFFYLVCGTTGTAATPGLLCQPRVIVKMIVENQMEWWLAGATEVLGENLPSATFVHHPGRRGGKPATNRLSYGATYVTFTTAHYEYSV